MTLDYGTSLRRRRRWIVWTALLAAATTCTIGVLVVGPGLLDDISHRLLVNRVVHRPPQPGVIAYTEDPSASLDLSHYQKLVYLPWAVGYQDRDMEEYRGWRLRGDAVVFFGHRRTSSGDDRLVIVHLSRANSPMTGEQVRTGVQLKAASVRLAGRGATEHHGDYSASLWIPLGPGQRATMYVGVPAPDDPSVVRIPYTVDGAQREITARVNDDGSVSLDATTGRK